MVRSSGDFIAPQLGVSKSRVRSSSDFIDFKKYEAEEGALVGNQCGDQSPYIDIPT
jgi:hypothetical protein